LIDLGAYRSFDWSDAKFTRIVGINIEIPEALDRASWAHGWISAQATPVYTVTMPCKREYKFSKDNFPVETMPCGCGNEKEFVVLWESEK